MPTNIIEVRSLTKRFGNLVAVDGVSLTVPAGGVFAFLGPNGAGKSTTIKILTTLLRPTSGQILIDGRDPVSEPATVRRAFGIVFQDPSLDNELTAEENMRFHAMLYGLPRPLYRERTRLLLGLVDLWERRGQFVKHFSGGMKRRLEIARGLLHHPKIIFLDEPTIGLDPQTRHLLWNYIRRLNSEEGVTVFFTTHHLEEAERFARTIGIIDHGKMLVEGTAAELKEKTGKTTLEDAFLALTGHTIREDEAQAIDRIRVGARFWGR